MLSLLIHFCTSCAGEELSDDILDCYGPYNLYQDRHPRSHRSTALVSSCHACSSWSPNSAHLLFPTCLCCRSYRSCLSCRPSLRRKNRLYCSPSHHRVQPRVTCLYCRFVLDFSSLPDRISLLVSFLQVCLIKAFIFSLLCSWVLEKLTLELTETYRRFCNLNFQMKVELSWLFRCFKTDKEKK